MPPIDVDVSDLLWTENGARNISDTLRRFLVLHGEINRFSFPCRETITDDMKAKAVIASLHPLIIASMKGAFASAKSVTYTSDPYGIAHRFLAMCTEPPGARSASSCAARLHARASCGLY